MQFYLNGYRPGDPLTEPGHPSAQRDAERVPAEVDVLIVGAGPAGLVLAAYMARFPEITTVVVDQRDGPLEVGQADGVACRTVEMLEAFGLATRLIDEAYWVNEVCFWQPDPSDRTRIARTGRVRDTDAELSEFPHVIVNQARMLAYLLDYMERSASRLKPLYGLRVSDLSVDGEGERPVVSTLRHTLGGDETGTVSEIRAKYVVGCDGARSAVRGAIGRELVGDAKNVSWGVLDVLTSTDFPDIRFKCTIQSAQEGSIVLIPREGGYLSRLYVELDSERDREMLAERTVTPAKLATVVNRIMFPYTIEVRDVGWWSVYEVGQRLCEKFDDVPLECNEQQLPRVFIAGDACHTHSAKAGQGMNVSMADAFNLGWKLAAVLSGRARPELLSTYSAERQCVAQELIDFDEVWSSMLSAPVRAPGDADGPGVDPDEFRAYFAKNAAYTAGVSTRYGPSMITSAGSFQRLAEGFPVGMRFHSEQVVRLADGKPVQLGHVARADGAWRLYVFANRARPDAPSSLARSLCEALASSPFLEALRNAGPEPDSLLDVRAVFQQRQHEVDIMSLPSILRPRKGRFELVDYEKVFCVGQVAETIFERRRVHRDKGCMVLVRPDQFVAEVLPLDRPELLIEFLSAVFPLERHGMR